MLRRFLIIWLTVSILGYGSAWAMDRDWTESLQQTGSHDSATQPDHDGDASESSCDHCCHGIAHLLGLISGPQFTSVSETEKLVETLPSLVFPRTITPPLQPPRG